MTSISELKNSLNTKTANLVLLQFATGGVFPIMWLYRHTKTVEHITGSKIAGDTFLIWMAVCSGLGLVLQASGAGSDDLAFLAISGILLAFAVPVLQIIWAFRASKALQRYALGKHRIDLRMNSFYTLVFNVFYVNYCINELPELARSRDLLVGVSAQPDVQDR